MSDQAAIAQLLRVALMVGVFFIPMDLGFKVISAILIFAFL